MCVCLSFFYRGLGIKVLLVTQRGEVKMHLTRRDAGNYFNLGVVMCIFSVCIFVCKFGCECV